MNIPRIFSENIGTPSMMRWLCLLALLNAIGLSWYQMIMKIFDVTIIIVFLGAAFGGKLGQKIFEEKKSDMPCDESSRANN